MQDRKVVTATKEKISDIALREKFNNVLSPKGTLLMSFKLTVGRTSVLGVDAVHNEAIISIYPYINDNNITRNYLMNILGLLVNYVEETDAIKGATLNSSKLKSMFVPLELGMFLSKLGRDKVAILLKEDRDFEKPSDIHGL